MIQKIITAFLFGLISAVLLGAVTGLVIMFVWNAVIPEVFGLPAIGFIQAWLLTILCSLLFKTSVTTKE